MNELCLVLAVWTRISLSRRANKWINDLSDLILLFVPTKIEEFMGSYCSVRYDNKDVSNAEDVQTTIITLNANGTAMHEKARYSFHGPSDTTATTGKWSLSQDEITIFGTQSFKKIGPGDATFRDHASITLPTASLSKFTRTSIRSVLSENEQSLKVFVFDDRLKWKAIYEGAIYEGI